jgi:hypothetical protein
VAFLPPFMAELTPLFRKTKYAIHGQKSIGGSWVLQLGDKTGPVLKMCSGVEMEHDILTRLSNFIQPKYHLASA